MRTRDPQATKKIFQGMCTIADLNDIRREQRHAKFDSATINQECEDLNDREKVRDCVASLVDKCVAIERSRQYQLYESNVESKMTDQQREEWDQERVGNCVTRLVNKCVAIENLRLYRLRALPSRRNEDSDLTPSPKFVPRQPIYQGEIHSNLACKTSLDVEKLKEKIAQERARECVASHVDGLVARGTPKKVKKRKKKPSKKLAIEQEEAKAWAKLIQESKQGGAQMYADLDPTKLSEDEIKKYRKIEEACGWKFGTIFPFQEEESHEEKMKRLRAKFGPIASAQDTLILEVETPKLKTVEPPRPTPPITSWPNAKKPHYVPTRVGQRHPIRGRSGFAKTMVGYVPKGQRWVPEAQQWMKVDKDPPRRF